MTQEELIAGTNRDLSLSQWLTPPELAQRVVEWAGPPISPFKEWRVLEPSAGNGALVRPLLAAGAQVCAVELDTRYFDALVELNPSGRVIAGNFLKLEPDDAMQLGRFDLVVTNPPYEEGQDVQFILHALKFAPRVVGIFRSALLHGATRKRELWSQVRPTRLAFLSERPKFGEGNGARSDFMVAELVSLRYPELHAGGPHPITVEVW